MVCSDKTLFVLAVTMCSKDGVNCVSSNRSFSNADFYRLASTSDFGAFVDVCAERLMANHMEHEFLERVCSDLSCVLTEDDLDSVSHDWVIAESARGQLHELKRASDGLVSPFDDDFPLLNKNVVKGSEKPFLLSYKGDLSLLGGINQNVAVIGLVNPDDSIAEREVRVVEAFVERGQAIVSGLAKGCDTVAHEACLRLHGKTIAFLPSPLASIVPAENRALANDIVENGGLLVSEYYLKPETQFESTKRFVERDRLQSMFSKAVVLSASYRKNEGDSGSRHAMAHAAEWGIERSVVFDESRDAEDARFGLNSDLVSQGVSPITQSEVKRLSDATVDLAPALPMPPMRLPL